MTPAITGLTYVGLTEFPIQKTPSVAHHVTRFFAVVLVVTYSAADIFHVPSVPEPVDTKAAQNAFE